MKSFKLSAIQYTHFPLDKELTLKSLDKSIIDIFFGIFLIIFLLSPVGRHKKITSISFQSVCENFINFG